MAEIKMMVTDLDGTLLKDDKSISEATESVIAKLHEKNIIFVIATARPIRSVKKFLPFVNYDAGVFHNGAVVINQNVLLDGFGIKNPVDITTAILNDKPDSKISIEANDVMYSNWNAEELWPGVDYIRTDDFREAENLIADKVLVEAYSVEEMNALQTYISDGLYLQLSENLVAMIMNRRATKTNGIKMLAQKYGISMEQIVAFGDDYNDIDMLESCGIGVAVDNALDEVKGVADYICGSNEQDGVAGWLAENVL